MRELQRRSRNDQHPPVRRLPPNARIILLLPFALLLFAYARTWDVIQWSTALSIAIQSLTDSKQVTIPEVKASGPTFSRSWYIESTAATAMGDMQALAERDVRWTMNSHQCDGKHYASFVLLDFGEPHTLNGVYGTFTVNTNVFWSDSDIADAAQHYLMSWHAVSSNCRLKLAVGLSNHHQCAYNGAACRIPEVGIRWAEMVTSLNTWIRSQGFDKQLQVWGAYDAETTWDGADRTRQFVDGFTAYDDFHVPLVDFGDMRQGDPLIDPDTDQPEQRWSDEDRYYVAWKAQYDVSLPEIYDPNDLWEWIRLQQNDHTMHFLGIMTEACTSRQNLTPTDPRVDCGSIFNGYGFAPDTAFFQMKQNMLQQAPLYYVTSMPVPY
jgi:hypothetical protein